MNEILYGKPVADQITEGLISEVSTLKSSGIYPGFRMIRVGNRPDDISYEKGATARCRKVGIECQTEVLDQLATQEELLAVMHKLNEDVEVHGILLFRPLPKHIDEEIIRRSINPAKDVDCMGLENQGKLYEGDQSGFQPCTPTAIMEMLKFYKIDTVGKEATIIGASNVVGKPMGLQLLNGKATITICNSKTKDVSAKSKGADILVVAVGKAEFVDESFVKEGAVVIDVGINELEGKLCGDVDFEKVKDKAGMITPVPGGVGAVTTSILAKHIVKACRLQMEKIKKI